MDTLGALQIGGPFGILLAFAGFLVKSFLDKRADDREETKSERESESGIVETTNSALKIVREQMQALSVELNTLRQENTSLRAQLANLNGRLQYLEDENARLQGGKIAHESAGPAITEPKRNRYREETQPWQYGTRSDNTSTWQG